MNFFQAVSAAITPAEGGIVTNGLIFHIDPTDSASYPGTGSTIYDLVGTNNGTFEGGVYVDSNGHLIFDGVNDAVNIGTINTTNPIALGVGDWSLQFWAYGLSSGLNYAHIYSQFAVSGTNDRVILFRFKKDQAAQSITIGSTYNQSSEALNTMPANTWVMVTSTYNRSTGYCEVYANETQVADFTPGAINNITRLLRIGARGAKISQNEFYGRIGAGLQYNRVLSASEISQNFNATKASYGL